MLDIVTTVITPAATYDLTDLPTAKDELSLNSTTDDAFLGRAISQVSASIAQYCNRVFPVETVQDVVYLNESRRPLRHEGSKIGAELQLSRWPIVEVTSVLEQVGPDCTLTLVEGTDFTVDTEKGWLIRLDCLTGDKRRWHALMVTVGYSGGYEDIPLDVADAALRMVTARYRSRGRDPMVRTVDTPGVDTRSYWVGGPPMSGSLPQEIAGILDNYRVPVIG